MDCLRILAMLMIVTLHGNNLFAATVQEQAQAFRYETIKLFVYPCVNLFVMLSGYFMIRSTFRLQKMVSLWLQVFFWSFFLKILMILFGQTPFSAISLASCFFPVLTGRAWFITIYVALYALSPFLNTWLYALTKKQHLALVLVADVLFTVPVSLHPMWRGVNSGGGWGLAWFVVLYVNGAYFRQHAVLKMKHSGLCLLSWGALAVFIAALKVYGGRIPLCSAITGNWFRYDSTPVLLMTLLIFTAFLNLRTHPANPLFSRTVSLIGPATLGVYLIHHHADFGPWMWRTFGLPSSGATLLYPLRLLVIAVTVFILCITLELLRQKTLGRLEKALCITRLCEFLTLRWHRLLDYLT